MSGTVIPLLSDVQMARRVARALPNNWAGEDALTEGVWSSLLECLGEELAFVLAGIFYTSQAARLLTSTFPELDLSSQDFLGSALPRPPGMPDADYAQLIIENLFQTAATRPALFNALLNLTGVPPRMLEPWNIFDTGVYDRNTYWDTDTVGQPGRWGGLQPYQGYIETAAPAIPAIGPNVPVYGWDSGAFWDSPGYFFGEISLPSLTAVYDTINRLKAEGTLVWVKILPATLLGTIVAPSPPLNVQATPQTFSSVSVTWQQSSVGTRPINYQVQFRLAGTTSWSSTPATTGTASTVTNLLPFTTYNFRVVATNRAGQSISNPVVSTTTLKQPPGPAGNLTATVVQSTAITITWTAPTVGTPPFTYVVQYRVTGTQTFSSLTVSPGATGVTIINLSAQTQYDIEVLTSTT